MLVLRRALRVVGLREGEGVLRKGVGGMESGSLVGGVRSGWMGLFVGGVEEWAAGLEMVLRRVV